MTTQMSKMYSSVAGAVSTCVRDACAVLPAGCWLNQGERAGVADSRLFGRRVSERVADSMFALSTSSRVDILLCLLDGACDVSELAARVEAEQSAVSHQLRVLRDHSLVRVERRGRQRVYMLYDEHVVALLRATLLHVEQRHRGQFESRGATNTAGR